LKDAGHRRAPVSTPVRVLKRIRNAEKQISQRSISETLGSSEVLSIGRNCVSFLYIPELAFRPGFRHIVQALPDTS
jgi:hypothetical protein